MLYTYLFFLLTFSVFIHDTLAGVGTDSLSNSANITPHLTPGAQGGSNESDPMISHLRNSLP